MRNNLDESVKAVVGIAPTAYDPTTKNGTGFDCMGFDDALVIVNCQTTATTGTLNIKVQESSDDDVADSYADVTDATFTEIDEDNDNTIYVGRVDLSGRERYLRIVGVVATAASNFGVTVILGDKSLEPVSQVNDVEFSV